jgi:hypothetical protein
MTISAERTGNLINRFVHEAEIAAESLRRQQNLAIACEHIQAALMEKLRINDATHLLPLKLDAQEMLSSLKGYNFRRFFPEHLGEIEIEESIIPSGCVRRLVEQTIRLGGEIWRIYRNDADPFPSSPHAHNVESGLTLHLGTGELFLRRKYAGEKVERKRLVALRQRIRNLPLPPLER